MNRIAIILAVVSVLGGCKKKSGGGLYVSMAKMSEFADTMCQCRDKACADSVQDRLTKWSTDLAEEEGESRTERLDEATIKKMTEIGQKYAECMTKAMRPDAEAPAPPPAPTKPALPAAVASPATVEAVLASARTWARGEHEQLHVVGLDVMYVGADGVVDPPHGKVSIELGRRTQSADDPNRRTGAPVTPALAQPTKCVQLEWTAEGWTTLARVTCWSAAAPFPRCTVPVVWKRAIDKGAPADALAVLSLRETANRSWGFTITDELRKVEIKQTIADDCAIVVEKP